MNKLWKKALVAGLLVLSVQGTGFAADDANDELTMLGVTKDGKEVDIPIKTRFYRRRLLKVFKVFGGETIPALNKSIASDKKFALKSVDIGISLAMGLDLGVVDMGIEPGMYLRFSR